MPSAQNNDSLSQLHGVISSFTSLTDPSTINDALIVIDNALQGIDSANVAALVKETIPLPYFIQLLQADYGNDTEQTIDRTCNVLELLLKNQKFSILIQDPLMSGALQQSLTSPSPRIHALGLSQVEKIENEDITLLQSLIKTDIFKAAIEGIGSENIAISEQSKHSFSKIFNTPDRLAVVINSEDTFPLIQDLVNSRNSIVKLRMVEVLTGLGGQSHESLAVLQKSNLLAFLKDGLASADILTRFNVIEILSEFGATGPGSDFLDESGIFTRIAEVVENEADQDSLGVNAIVKFYGKIGSSDQVDFISLDMKYQILTQLEKLMVGDDDFEPDELLKSEAMASLGLIGGNVHNIEWVSQSHCIQTFIDRLAMLTRDLKVVWHHSLAQILACSSNPSADVEKIIREFYKGLEKPGQSPFVARLSVSAKSQSVELAMSALSVMIPLARYSFGTQQIGLQRDVMSFLLDRNAELTHAQKVAKFEVIEGMLETAERVKKSSNENILSLEQLSRLDLVRRQGPFYQRATATVALQDMAA